MAAVAHVEVPLGGKRSVGVRAPTVEAALAVRLATGVVDGRRRMVARPPPIRIHVAPAAASCVHDMEHRHTPIPVK